MVSIHLLSKTDLLVMNQHMYDRYRQKKNIQKGTLFQALLFALAIKHLKKGFFLVKLKAESTKNKSKN